MKNTNNKHYEIPIVMVSGIEQVVKEEQRQIENFAEKISDNIPNDAYFEFKIGIGSSAAKIKVNKDKDGNSKIKTTVSDNLDDKRVTVINQKNNKNGFSERREFNIDNNANPLEISEICRKEGMTQEDAGDVAGISSSTISRNEKKKK